jgi:hypothetical protein
MAGIFPQAGTQAENAQNAQVGVKTVANCDPLFYRTNCAVRFDPVSTNALISEIANAVNAADKDYDCSRLDNLALAIKELANLCRLAGVQADADDLIAGCYDGQQGLASVRQLLNLAPAIFDVGPITANDYIGFLDSETGIDKKITYQNLKNTLFEGGGGAPIIIPNGPIVSAFGTDKDGNFSMAGQNAGVVYWHTGTGADVRIGAITLVAPNGFGGLQPTTWGQAQGSAVSGGDLTGIFSMVRKNGSWYVVQNGVGMLCGGDALDYSFHGSGTLSIMAGLIL